MLFLFILYFAFIPYIQSKNYNRKNNSKTKIPYSLPTSLGMYSMCVF